MRTRQKLFQFAVLGVASMYAGTSHAFLEDVCYTSSGTLFNCEAAIDTVECVPGSYNNVNQCAVQLAAEYEAGQQNADSYNQTTSTMHRDVTFYLAEYVGFSPTQAYWITAYDQAMDLGQYAPRGKNGLLLAIPSTCSSTPTAANCNLLTKMVDGLERGSNTGTLMHYEAPFNGTNAVELNPVPNGLVPSTTNPEVELSMVHYKNWALGNPLLCMDGITTQSSNGDYATGTQCYVNADGSVAQVSAETSMIDGPQTSYQKDGNVALGLQVISAPANEPAVLSNSFSSYIGANQALARMGIYLHTYQDRITHHACLDYSFLNGPLVPQGTEYQWNADMLNSGCQQTDHLVRHSWETGVNQSQLEPSDQTMGAAINGTITELVMLAQYAGVKVNAAASSANISVSGSFAAKLYAATQIADAQGRVTGMANVASNAGLGLMPGF